MMDTIIFNKGTFQPLQWIYTDVKGQMCSKSLNEININEVIKAFLINLNPSKKREFSNEDLIMMLEKEKIE